MYARITVEKLAFLRRRLATEADVTTTAALTHL
jgi:hypothetical protein